MSLFDVPGNVHPSTYDWKKDFGGLALSTRESRIFYVELDVSRVLGLAQYAEELEEKLKNYVSNDTYQVLVGKKEALEKEVRELKKKLEGKTPGVKEKQKPGPKKKGSEDLF